MKTKIKQLGTLALVAAICASICLLTPPAKADTAAGEAAFKAKCAGCHGADGKGKEAMKTTDMAAADVQKLRESEKVSTRRAAASVCAAKWSLQVVVVSARRLDLSHVQASNY